MFYNILKYINIKIYIFSGSIKFLIKHKNIKKKCLKQESKGGNGGGTYLILDKFIKSLNFYKKKNIFFSENGHNIKSSKKYGKFGRNLILRIPYNIFLFNYLDKKILKHKYNKIFLLEGEVSKKKNDKLIFLKKKIFLIFIFKKKLIFYYLRLIKKKLKIFYIFLKIKNKKYYFLNFFYFKNVFNFINKFKLFNLDFYNLEILNYYRFRKIIK